jgi:hypothetical protein
MIDDERLGSLLRASLPRSAAESAPRDLWPLVEERLGSPVRWSWLDLGVAVAVAGALVISPEWLSLLVFHL